MNETDEREAFKLLKSLMPRTTDEQAILCIQKVLSAPIGVVVQAIKTHAETEVEGRLSIPWVKNEIERILFHKNHRQKWEAACAEKQAMVELIQEEKEAADQSVGAAKEFCQAHANKLDEWRAVIVKEHPHLGTLCQKRKTLESTTLVCAIYHKYGDVA